MLEFVQVDQNPVQADRTAIDAKKGGGSVSKKTNPANSSKKMEEAVKDLALQIVEKYKRCASLRALHSCLNSGATETDFPYVFADYQKVNAF